MQRSSLLFLLFLLHLHLHLLRRALCFLNQLPPPSPPLDHSRSLVRATLFLSLTLQAAQEVESRRMVETKAQSSCRRRAMWAWIDHHRTSQDRSVRASTVEGSRMAGRSV